jgi:hypothetical protein
MFEDTTHYDILCILFEAFHDMIVEMFHSHSNNSNNNKQKIKLIEEQSIDRIFMNVISQCDKKLDGVKLLMKYFDINECKITTKYYMLFNAINGMSESDDLLELLMNALDYGNYIAPENVVILDHIGVYSCQNGNAYVSGLKKLMSYFDSKIITNISYRKCNSIHIACEKGYSTMMELFMNCLDDDELNKKTNDGKGFTPLHIACYNDSNDIIIMLLNRLNNTQAMEKDIYGFTYIDIIKNRNNILMIEKLGI